MDREARMFITQGEFDRLVERLVQAFRLTTATDPDYVYVTYDPTAAPGEVGQGIRLQRPRFEDRTLYLVQHDLRTDDADLARLFDRMRRRWRKFLGRPVLARNFVYRSSWIPYRDVGFTAGAKALLDEGWMWRQKGVANVEYAAPEGSEAPPAVV